MLRAARTAFSRGRGAPRFVFAAAEALPFAAGTFDLTISNGVLNLSPDKPRAFAEIFRVLLPGGAFRFADVVRKEGIPADVAARLGAWSA
jgi:arsenite methyltransferase